MSEERTKLISSDSFAGSILFREHRGGLYESMRTCRGVKNIGDLRSIVKERYGQGEVTVKPYTHDDRIDWDTQIVCLNGNAVGFTSAPFPSNAEVSHDAKRRCGH